MSQGDILTLTTTKTKTKTTPTTAKKKKKIISSLCLICDAPARYSYYGAIVCHSCKVFFRRHAQRDAVSEPLLPLRRSTETFVRSSRNRSDVIWRATVESTFPLVVRVRRVDWRSACPLACLPT